jgi:hypothetical protein
VQALVFTSEPKSPKNLSTQGVFKDSENVEGKPPPGALGWMMTARGGVRLDGKVRGGATADYWSAYRDMMRERGLSIEPWIEKALADAGQVVSNEQLDQLAARASSDPAAAKQLAAMAERYAGAATPIEYRAKQRVDGPVRVKTDKAK